jgi:Right handed beta helix region
VTHWFVALGGDDDNSGLSPGDAFRHVAHGVDQLDTGDTLFIRDGVYTEHVTIERKTRVTIQSLPGEHAVIDGARDEFRAEPGQLWRPGDVEGEFVTLAPYPVNTDRGAFLDRDRHTRLITYSRLEDLQASNETFGPLLPGQGPPGPTIVSTDEFTKRPWVYMGPGLHQGGDGFIHVRLSHTHLGLPGVEDYDGPEEPGQLPLAIWTAPDPTVTINRCQTLHLENVTVRFGGGRSILIASSNEVFLDHINVLAGPYGLEVGVDCDRTTLTNCSFDGGLPPWSFRSDRKDGYTIAGGGANGLAEQTMKTLAYCENGSSRTRFENCEFTNAHDLQLNGPGTVFRHNWVRNFNDDAIFVGKAATNLRITSNVIEKCLTVLSLASKSSAGPVFLHRNLIDLRAATVGRRPLTDPNAVPEDERPVMRFGNMFKSNFADPDLTVFHNTVLINQSQRATHNLFRSYDGASRRRVLNNIFVGINNAGAVDRPLAYLPAITDDAETDGNCYWGINREPRILLVVRQPGGATPIRFDSVDPDLLASDYFQDSEMAHPPGYEAHGTTENPRLRRFWGPVHFPVVEDLRLAKGSSAHHRGVELTDPVLREIDGNPPTGERPDSGCYPFASPPIAVGVDGLCLVPSNPLVGPLPVPPL